MKLSFVFENFLQLAEMLRLVGCVMVRTRRRNIYVSCSPTPKCLIFKYCKLGSFSAYPTVGRNWLDGLPKADAGNRDFCLGLHSRPHSPNRSWEMVRKLKSGSQRFISEWKLDNGTLYETGSLPFRKAKPHETQITLLLPSLTSVEPGRNCLPGLFLGFGGWELSSRLSRFDSLREEPMFYVLLWQQWGKYFHSSLWWPPHSGDKERPLLTCLFLAFGRSRERQ